MGATVHAVADALLWFAQTFGPGIALTFGPLVLWLAARSLHRLTSRAATRRDIHRLEHHANHRNPRQTRKEK
jgi:hypothetical protein